MSKITTVLTLADAALVLLAKGPIITAHCHSFFIDKLGSACYCANKKIYNYVLLLNLARF